MSPLEHALSALLGRMHSAVTVDMKVDLLERLTWLVDDNGTELSQIRKVWARGADPDLVDVALAPWRSPIAATVDEAEQLLAPLGRLRQYQGRVEERLKECLG